MMLAGSLWAAIAEARAWRSMWGWAASPTLAARRVKARLAWLGLTGGAAFGAEHQVQLDRPGRPTGLDVAKLYGGRLAEGEAEAGLLAAVMA
jgi:hypothetical protein